jgi:hypothetical protein
VPVNSTLSKRFAERFSFLLHDLLLYMLQSVRYHSFQRDFSFLINTPIKHHKESSQMQTIEILQYAKTKITDDDYFIWYLFYCYSFADKKSKNTESHHILPKGIFPEFDKIKDAPWNRCNLPKFNHYLAHYILVQGMRNPNNLAALNLMGRASKTEEEIEIKANLYKEYRDEIALNASIRNTGKKLTAEQKRRMSEHMANKIVVRYPNETTGFQIDRNDPRYINGEVIPMQVGRIHSEKTKKKMSENGIKDTTAYHNGVDWVYLKNDQPIPEGHTKGLPDSFANNAKERFTNAEHFHNPITNESIRVKAGSHIPIGFVKGRSANFTNPFSGNMLIKNYITNGTTLAPVSSEYKYPFMCGGTKCKFAFVYNDHFTLMPDILSEKFPHLTWNIIKAKLYKPDTIIHHHKLTPEDRETLKDCKFYKDFPLQIIPIKDFIAESLHTRHIWIT